LPEGSLAPQYWQELPSRSKIPLRETARFCRGIRRYFIRRTTLGTGTWIFAVRMVEADTSSTTAAPLNTSVRARRALVTLIAS
jgi:hypothetical protein